MKKATSKLKPAPYKALSIAKFLFSLDPHREYFKNKKIIQTGAGFSGVLLGNWRLNQMLYLLQVFHYAKYGYFLFRDNLYAFDNGFIVYDVYRNFWALYDEAWLLDFVEEVENKETKNFLCQYFNYFKNYSVKGLEKWYTNDPAWIEAWLENKKEPQVEFTPQTLAFYRNFLDSHLQRIEQAR